MFGLFKRHKEVTPEVLRKNTYGYLGKTALKPDFIKFQVNSRESIALDHWIKEGFAYASRNSLQGNPQNNTFGLTNLFFMAGNDTEASLIGVITPSLDSSGRHYPFVSFINTGQELYRTHPAALFLNDSNDFNHLHQIVGEVFASSSDEEMQKQSSQLEHIVYGLKQPAVINQLLEKFRHIPMEALWTSVGIDDLESRAVLIHESSLILKSIANRGCLRSQQGLRFPMPKLGDGFEVIAAFWLHLVTAVVADHNWRPWVFYQVGRDDKSASLTIFTTPMAPSYFDSIWSDASANNAIIELNALKATQSLSEASLSLAKMNNVSMYDALRRWCKA
ncbi:type VI secretion system-associated protein TagF [Colwellia sp. D2M02]|uniref:type VI secretion system-associated protein TagF n=1 Tax=Colwellia sp. D2M02 TaxID=2841562 RepID=UPI001C0A08D3|nr:type VI secretion system-associated protein TagF [Colwellia sp. D2M02]MBU2894376.1 type VI secretion system-associated protein TagF [Colwellia sp. D2M02]